MYEFRIVVGMEKGGEQVFIVNADAETAEAAEDQVRYLVTNSLSVLSIAQINIHE